MFKGKSIVVGVCGGIAAYKAVDVVSRLIKLGFDVDVIMTENASKFVAPLTFQSISGNPVIVGMFEKPDQWNIAHISLAEKADLVVIIPATANIIGKVANGIADDMLSTTIMATKAKVVFFPAMNTNMFENKIFQLNLEKLRALGYQTVSPDSGRMACGTIGIGRLPEPEKIVEHIINSSANKSDLSGLNILVTAGPTREQIDPVRYISNYSSGKMGYAVVDAALQRGATVHLVTGPVDIKPDLKAQVYNVQTALEMYEVVMKQYTSCDILIMVAAVADYRAEAIGERKIKKSEESLNIRLVKNPDIAFELGKIKENRVLVGFSAETDNLYENAKEKLKRKKFDIIVANDVSKEGAGFGTDTNIASIMNKDGQIDEVPLISKIELAHKILDEALTCYENLKL